MCIDHVRLSLFVSLCHLWFVLCPALSPHGFGWNGYHRWKESEIEWCLAAVQYVQLEKVKFDFHSLVLLPTSVFMCVLSLLGEECSLSYSVIVIGHTISPIKQLFCSVPIAVVVSVFFMNSITSRKERFVIAICMSCLVCLFSSLSFVKMSCLYF